MNPPVLLLVNEADLTWMKNHIARVGPFNRFINRKTFWEGLRIMDTFVQPIITQCLSLDPSTLKNSENQSFLHALANTTRDRKVIRDQIVAVLLAGRDTTAGTLSFLFHELSQHPEIVFKLRQEILRTVGSHRVPTYDDLKGMGYLQHCLSETMRMYPAVPFNVTSTNLSNPILSSPPLTSPPRLRSVSH